MKRENYSYNNAFYLLLLLLCCLAAFWPLTFHVFSLKNDALNYFLPVRHQVSEAISSGYWPFWSPYFNLGYPLHGDMQSGVWNPFVQLFSLFGPYTLRMLQYETVLYVYLSGVGMFYLLRYFNLEKNICLLGAASFMLCGYNSDSAQFLNWISSASFIPFVFLFYYKMLAAPSFKNALYCGFFLYLLFSTAYPADFILMCYLMLAFFTWHLIKTKSFKNKKSVAAHLRSHITLCVCFILLALPAILSYYQFLTLTERGTGASFEDAMSNPLHPLFLFSYITPLGVWKAHNIGLTDPLERNSFIGIITFSLFLFSLLIKTKNPFLQFCKWAALIFTIFSFGEMGGLRVLAYYTLPLMNAFRHPANAKIFTLFFAVILAAFALQQSNNVAFARYRKYAFYTLVFLLMVLVSWAFTGTISLFHISHNSSAGFGMHIKSIIENLTFHDLILINILLQLPFIAALYFFFVKRVVVKWLVIASILNCILHTVLFQPFTVVKKDSATHIQNVLNEISIAGYPLPDAASTLENNSVKNDFYFNEIGAANMYNKKIGRIDYRITPSNLRSQNEFWFNENTRSKLFDYSLIYAADTAIRIADSATLNESSKRVVLLADTALVSSINKNQRDTNKIKFTRFSPNGWDIEINSKAPAFYALFQNYYPRWQLKIDGKKALLVPCNISFMGFYLPAGIHSVTFYYQATDIKISYMISLLLTIAIMCFAGYQFYVKKKINSSFSA